MVRDVPPPRPAGDLLPSLPAPAACPFPPPPSQTCSSRFWSPPFFLSPPRLPSALLSPPSTCFLLISAFREAGGWEKSPRFRTRKFKFRGDKICPRSQRWCQESNWLSMTPAQGSLHCRSCTAGPAPANTPGSHRCTHTPHSIPLPATLQRHSASRGGHRHNLISRSRWPAGRLS